MSGQSAEEFELNFPMLFRDYAGLQLWMLWRSWRWVIPLAVLFLVALTLWPLLDSHSLTDSITLSWGPLLFDVVIVPIFFGLVAAFVLAVLGIRWLRGRLPRALRAKVTDAGVTICGEHFDYNAHWPSATYAAETRAAYLLRFKNLFVRLPKRGFTPSQRASLEILVKRHVPAKGNRL